MLLKQGMEMIQRMFHAKVPMSVQHVKIRWKAVSTYTCAGASPTTRMVDIFSYCAGMSC